MKVGLVVFLIGSLAGLARAAERPPVASEPIVRISTAPRASTGEISELMTAGPGAIRFRLARPGQVTGKVYDLAGRLAYTFPSLYLEAGTHVLRWGGRTTEGAAASYGIYFVRLRLDNGVTAAQKLVWMR